MTRGESCPQAAYDGLPGGCRRVVSLRSRLRHTVCALSAAAAGDVVLAAILAPGLVGRQSAAEAAVLQQISLGLGGQLAEAHSFAQGLASV